MTHREQFTLPEDRKTADLAMLRRLTQTPPVQRRRPAKRTICLAGGAAVLIGGGVATAAVIEHLNPTPASDTKTGRCYTELSTNFGDNFPGVSIGNAYAPSATSAPPLPPTLIQDCSDLWRHGGLTLGHHGDGNYSDTTNVPVPPLSACVLPNGQGATFPGTDSCAQLGLPPLTGS